MYVITGATGRTGSVAARTLLDRGHKVRVVVRDEARGAEWKKRGAEVAIARFDDTAALSEALRGADAVYLMVPPNMTSNAVLADQGKVVDALVRAVAAAKPKRVVLLSSVGAEHESGTGPIQTLHYAEKKLGALAPLTALRPAYFMENWAGVVPVAQAQSILPSTLRSDRSFPMVATEDIGRVVAELLVDGKPGVVELAGPQEYSPLDAGAALTKILGKPIKVIDVPDEGVVPALKQAGFTDDLAALFREMVGGFNSGRVLAPQKPLRGTVTLEAVLRQLVK
jgi:uncharacterized protein YbjT (DUF2867 family)